MKNNSLPLSELIALFAYDPVTGIFTHRVGPKLGTRAGAVHKIGRAAGYRFIRFRGHCIGESRLAVAFSKGAWPENQVDHINRVTNDNRLVNLRVVTQSQNNLNRSIVSRGYYRQKNGRYRAYVCREYLGMFDTAEQAAAAHQAAVERKMAEVRA